MKERRLARAFAREVKHQINPVYRKENRELARLARLPRGVPSSTRVLGKTIRLTDGPSFVSAYRQIFQKEIYAFRSSGRFPHVLDCGANIGLSVLYWKRAAPSTRILAFEPDEAAFAALRWNCEEWGLTNVELVNAAVWVTDGTSSFVRDVADSGRLAPSPPHGASDEVKTLRLRSFLATDISLLKLDIEGSETEVLTDCADSLERVQRIFVEWHSFVSEPQTIDEILTVLRSAGFRIHIQPEWVSPSPLRNIRIDGGMDQRLNIFGLREGR